MPKRRDLARIASMHGMNRRELVRLGALGAGGLMIRSLPVAASTAAPTGATMLDFHDDPMDVVRIGFVGVGLQGTAHVENFLKIDGVEIRAVCDIVEDRVERAQQHGGRGRSGRNRRATAAGPRDFERLCDRSDLDLVFCSTPWEWHVPVCVGGHGKRQARRHRSAHGPDRR